MWLGGSPAGGGNEQATPWVPHVVPAGVPGTGTQPDGSGGAPGSQMPSASNPNSVVPGAASGSAVIELGELFCTPISESSEASYGPCVVSCATDGPAPVIVTRNWQLLSASTGGHCKNGCACAAGAANTAIADAVSTPTRAPRPPVEPGMRAILPWFADQRLSASACSLRIRAQTCACCTFSFALKRLPSRERGRLRRAPIGDCVPAWGCDRNACQRPPAMGPGGALPTIER